MGPKSMDDDQLLCELCGKRNKAAFTELALRYDSWIRSVSLHLFINSPIPDELLDEFVNGVRLKLWTAFEKGKYKKLPHISAFTAWATKIIRNHFIDLARKVKRESDREWSFSKLAQKTNEDDWSTNLEWIEGLSSEPSRQENVVMVLRNLINTALAAVAKRDALLKDLIIWKYFHGRSNNVIAQSLDISIEDLPRCIARAKASFAAESQHIIRSLAASEHTPEHVRVLSENWLQAISEWAQKPGMKKIFEKAPIYDRLDY